MGEARSAFAMVEVRRVELLTSCLQSRRSSQLSYTPRSSCRQARSKMWWA